VASWDSKVKKDDFLFFFLIAVLTNRRYNETQTNFQTTNMPWLNSQQEKHSRNFNLLKKTSQSNKLFILESKNVRIKF